MTSFRYSAPTDVQEAVSLAAENPGAQYIAGGTTVVDLIKEGVFRPTLLIDLNKLPLHKIAVHEGRVEIGALVTVASLARHEKLATRFPMLSEALLAGASPQLRNMATIGGNLLQRTRCAYYRDLAVPCNKRLPGSGCSAIGGVDGAHAILGGSQACIAVYPSDAATALTALDASLSITGPRGDRTLPLASLHRPPADTPHVETNLAPDEIITSIRVDDHPAARRSCYVKARDRASFAFALASVAAGLVVDGGNISSARIALGGVATTPWRAYRAEESLMGARPNRDSYDVAAKVALADASAGSDNGYKIVLAKRLIVRALERAGAMG
jgi:xanthine dehydrogenase YagS FAD-binding subunit